ncbi:MAG: peptide chain release factor 1 [Rhodobacteraceae bacterium]|nr:peptide chain release factor 1 [Paracoccaceae bacterium]
MVSPERLDQIAHRFAWLETRMAQGNLGAELAALGREYAELKPIMEQITTYRRLRTDLEAAEAMRSDAEMRLLAEEEIAVLTRRLPEVERALQLALLPRDSADSRAAMIEIRPGTGGEEAALFARDLLRMYQRHAEQHGWRFEIMAEQASDLGGIKEVIAHARGADVFARLKYESGVHRVQRVPETESGGRVHTSAATVAVLPEAEEVDIRIDPADLRIDTMRASGAGGQHVNTTDSAVRITHIPSGIVVTSAEKSQHRNREMALQVLRARLYDQERQRLAQERSADRRSQVGTGDRSERIRTYNFPQARVTDHRINLTLYRLEQVLAGDLDEMIDALIAWNQAMMLAQPSP